MRLEAETFTLLQLCFVRTLARREACVGAYADAKTTRLRQGTLRRALLSSPKPTFGRPHAVSIQGRVAC